MQPGSAGGCEQGVAGVQVNAGSGHLELAGPPSLLSAPSRSLLCTDFPLPQLWAEAGASLDVCVLRRRAAAPPVSFPACFPGCREEQRAPGEQHFFFFQVRQQLCAWFLSLFRADVAVVAVLDCSPGAQGKVMVVSGASSRVGSSAGGCWVEKEAWG